MTERWVKVAGHERYIVSDRGRVRLGRVNAPILKGSYDWAPRNPTPIAPEFSGQGL